ncbi:MAG: hypothetical protein EZS28_022387, partial [Streblomastix strix]
VNVLAMWINEVNYPLGQKDGTGQKLLSPRKTRDILTY